MFYHIINEFAFDKGQGLSLYHQKKVIKTFRLISQFRYCKISQTCIPIDISSCCLGSPVTLMILMSKKNSNLEQDFKSGSIKLFGALQKHRKVTKIETILIN